MACSNHASREKAVEAVNTAQSTHTEITGWAMVGGWPLCEERIEMEARAVKVVAVDAAAVAN